MQYLVQMLGFHNRPATMKEDSLPEAHIADGKEEYKPPAEDSHYFSCRRT